MKKVKYVLGSREVKIPHRSFNFKNSICVYDIVSDEISYFADYNPKTKRVIFGGYWCSVPIMKSEKTPTEDEVDAFANKFKRRSSFLFSNYIEYYINNL